MIILYYDLHVGNSTYLLFKPFQLVISHELRAMTRAAWSRTMNVSGNPNDILSLFYSYGYLIIFFGVMLDNVGLPIPGELFLLLAGALAATGMDMAQSLLAAVA